MVTVVIPTYNREKTILRAINSVLNQTYSDLELIVVDDCSTDDTKKVVLSICDSRLKYVCLEKNSGACAARNKGIELAKGEYIAFQDSDDEWYSTKLQSQLITLEKTNADIVFCGFDKILNNNDKKAYPAELRSHWCTQEELITNSIASTQTIIGKTAVIRDIKFDVAMPRMQDYDFIIRASEQYKIYYLNEFLVAVYEQPDSITATIRQYEKRLEVTKQLLKKYNDLAKKYPEWEINMLKIIAHCEVMLKRDALGTLSDIYTKESTKYNKIKIILYKIGILRLLFAIEDRRRF